MSAEIRLSRFSRLSIIFICVGTISLVVSYLFFINIFGIPFFNICGSACEWWWSFIIDIPPQGACIEVCIMRNWLYKPLFVIGGFLDIIGLIFGALAIFIKP